MVCGEALLPGMEVIFKLSKVQMRQINVYYMINHFYRCPVAVA